MHPQRTRRLIIAVAVALAALAGGWIWLKRQYQEPAAELVPLLAEHFAARSVLAIFAHPDDEIAVAGLLDDAAHRDGTIVRIITVTRGESGKPEPPICRLADLGVIRQAETLKRRLRARRGGAGSLEFS